ncbi:tetratricopeptide repeat protein 12 isoform X1 [Gopherus evgoodei]|uniref:tetratricopeptide repeat protein 12 isoform X1 n=2 Tax=Gopherus evgoodei TaxID=1825980 RepID=UPI0011CF4725|nr:tetratricopeptide repeat protein 12 isoform X1 [Gopherus evgoodei]XP_030394289.1 tetratricopeptide repeat protein 12 isoform X1 [Gopherus evgoodei]
MMADELEERDLQKFLRDVDEIANLVQGLNSTDPAVQEKAISDTEKRLHIQEVRDDGECKTKLNRTVVNSQDAATRDMETVRRDSFMSALEKDAKERAKRRKKNERLANALKEKGNDAFSKGDYATAIQLYTEGLEKQKDMQVLYTNRAQAHMKLQEYKKVISDCEWALKCNEKCIKAYFHMGKAHLALKDYNESRKSYQKILEIDPQKDSLFKDCMNEVDLQERKEKEEEKALEEFQSGMYTAVSVKELLQKLNRPDQNILYYAGGIRVLTESIKDCTEQILFRTNNGFSIISDNKVIRRGLSVAKENTAEAELSISLLILWQAVCAGNEENQRLLLTHPDVNVQLPMMLSSDVPEIQMQSLALLSLYSQTENGRRLLVRHQNLTKWLQMLIAFVSVMDDRASCAMNLLSNLIKEEKFKIQCRIKLSTSVLPLFAQLLKTVKQVNQPALTQCIGIMGDLCADVVIRLQMAENQECWQACLKLVDECCSTGNSAGYQECLFTVLGLMMNLSLESNLVIQEHAVDVSRRCLFLLGSKDGKIVTRAIGVLSHILPVSLMAIEEAVAGGVVKRMLRFLKAGGPTTSCYAIKTLAVCTQSNSQAREEVVKSDKKFDVLLKLLASENEMVVGNAAFCLSKCFEVPGAASSLLNSNIVMILLKHAGGEAKKTSVQENAAVALGKLCTAEPRHILQLRELNGMAILNSSMKYVQGL